MPAIHTEDFIRTGDPRVTLPPPAALPAPVRAAAENFLRLYRERAEAQSAVDRAKRAVYAAEAADAEALAGALHDGTKEPKPRAATEKAEAALAEVRARWQAHRRAVVMAHTRLREAVAEHRDEWLAQVEADQADAVSRLEQAARDWSGAHRDLVTLGGVAAMLRANPEGLTVGTYRPATRLSIAAGPLADAVAAVQADQREAAPAPAEDEAVEVEIAV